jgi:hypothetical protein
VGQLAQLGHGQGGGVLRLGQERGGASGVDGEGGPGDGQVEGEPDEALLRPVVQVPLDAAPLPVDAGGEAGPAGPGVVEGALEGGVVVAADDAEEPG